MVVDRGRPPTEFVDPVLMGDVVPQSLENLISIGIIGLTGHTTVRVRDVGIERLLALLVGLIVGDDLDFPTPHAVRSGFATS